MRKTLEKLYFGNITPNEQKMEPGSELKKAVDRVVHYENQLTELLDENGQTILTKLIRSQHEINSITALENFILGFRLGAKITMPSSTARLTPPKKSSRNWQRMASCTCPSLSTVSGLAMPFSVTIMGR